MAPTMSFTADEVWELLPNDDGRPESVHLALFPDAAELAGDVPADFDAAAHVAEWTSLLSVRDEALKVLEVARADKQIGGGLEAQLHHQCAGASVFAAVERIATSCATCLSCRMWCSKSRPPQTATPALQIKVSKAPGAKCERCWNYSTHVGEDAAYPTVCERCSAVLAEIEATAGAH